MKKGGYPVLIICLLLTFMISLAYYLFSYKPNQDQLHRIRKKIQDLESDIKVQEDSIDKSKDTVSQMELGLVNLNYFARNRVIGEEKTPFFLRELNNLANSLGIRLVSIFPIASEEKKGYIKEAFEVNLKTDFQRLLRLLLYLQDTQGLNIDRLNIELAESNGSIEIRALMMIHTLEMINKEDQKVKTLEDLRALHLRSEPELKDLKLNTTQKIKTHFASLDMFKKGLRDPFVKPIKIQQLHERLKEMERELAESQLLGIIDFEGQRHAIIGRNTVKKGDRIFNMDVLDITHDKVVLGIGELRFTYKIKKNGD